MVAAPVLLLQQVSAYAPDTNVTIMFTLLPVVVVLVWGAAQNGQSGMAALLPALVGASGVLLILPFEQPESLRGWLAMGEALVAMLLTGLGGVWLHRCLRGEHILRALAVAGSANATVLLIWSLVRGERLWLGWDLRNIAVALVGAIAFAVTLWLAKAIDPVRFSTRYLLIPLVTIVEGMILLRPPLTGRLIGGVSLLLMGTIWLQSRDERVDEKVLSLK
jgi:drug/metabolite transporter (DMT)-like permease